MTAAQFKEFTRINDEYRRKHGISALVPCRSGYSLETHKLINDGALAIQKRREEK